MDGIRQRLDDVHLEEWSTLSLARWDDGTVVISPKFNFTTSPETTTVYDPALETGIEYDAFNAFKSLVNFSKPWKPVKVLRRSHYSRTTK